MKAQIKYIGTEKKLLEVSFVSGPAQKFGQKLWKSNGHKDF